MLLRDIIEHFPIININLTFMKFSQTTKIISSNDFFIKIRTGGEFNVMQFWNFNVLFYLYRKSKRYNIELTKTCLNIPAAIRIDL